MPRKKGKKASLVALRNYIVPESPQSARDKELIFAEVPRNTRVYVKEEGGVLKYKDMAVVRDSDTLIYKKDGSPVIMRGRPGRVSGDRVKLEAADQEVAEVNRQRDEHIVRDPLVQAARINSDSAAVLSETIIRLTEVASSIGFERQDAQRKGIQVSVVARREVAALVAIRDASLRRVDQRLRKQEIDLESLAFRNLFVYMVRTFTGAMDAVGVPAQEIDSVVSFLSKEVDTEEWKNSAVKSMSSPTSVVH